MRHLVATLVALAVACAAAPAAGQTAPAAGQAAPAEPLGWDQPAETPAPGSEWYGWQTLTVDLSAFLLLASAVAIDEDDTSPLLALVALSGAALGPPIVHWGHAHGTRGLASLGLRLGAVLLAAVAVPVLGSGDSFEDEPFVGLGVGFAGWVMASVIDAAILAFD